MNHISSRTYDRYLAAWSPVSAMERCSLLTGSLAQHVVFKNPTQTRRGLLEIVKHLEGFQVRCPGGGFQMNNMLGWGKHALAEWQLVDGSGTLGFSGFDIVTFNRDGLISSILLFGAVETQKLAWRRRADVMLESTV